MRKANSVVTGTNSNVVELTGKPRETREQVLDRLFREHGTALRGFLKARLGVNQELDDMVQDVFAKLAKLDDLPERLHSENRSARSFIFTVANNLVLDVERSKTVRRKYLANLQQELTPEDALAIDSPEVIVLAREELEIIKKVIVNLRPVWRQAFVLNRFKHRSFTQIAEEMGISVKTVEKYMKKALTQIRNAAVDTAQVEQRR